MKSPIYLIKVEPNTNNNKFYKMTPQENGNSFAVEYGRVGQTPSRHTYSIDEWDKKLREKLRKGYVDKTILLIEPALENKSPLVSIENEEIRSIVQRLMSYAKRVVEERYTISSSAVTQNMINEAQAIINHMASLKDINAFNKALVKLFTTIPRRMGKVSEYLPTNISAAKEILSREQDLLDVMLGQVQTKKATDNNDESKTSFLESLGISFSRINDEDREIIRLSLGELANRYVNAWSVTNLKTQKNFEQHVEQEKIKVKKYLWHGSLNENWWNIINSGLLINPPAKTTGKAFGYGIYFAPKARKSLGYTSIQGSYWARGNSDTAFMSLYNTAYGIPHEVYSNSGLGDTTYKKLRQINPKANCLHAKEGSYLRNDEIIFYNESQVTIKYLVEIR